MEFGQLFEKDRVLRMGQQTFYVVVLLEHMVGFGVQEFPVVVCPAIL